MAFLLPAESRVVKRSARSLAIARSYSVDEMATSTRCAVVELMRSLSSASSNEKWPCSDGRPPSIGLVGARSARVIACESYHEDTYISTRDTVSRYAVESCEASSTSWAASGG